jgi:hypothetical protein
VEDNEKQMMMRKLMPYSFIELIAPNGKQLCDVLVIDAIRPSITEARCTVGGISQPENISSHFILDNSSCGG